MTTDLLHLEPATKKKGRRPPWIKVRAPEGENYQRLIGLMRSNQLHTVCEAVSYTHLTLPTTPYV